MCREEEKQKYKIRMSSVLVKLNMALEINSLTFSLGLYGSEKI